MFLRNVLLGTLLPTQHKTHKWGAMPILAGADFRFAPVDIFSFLETPHVSNDNLKKKHKEARYTDCRPMLVYIQ
jgi:hypothetical protein